MLRCGCRISRPYWHAYEHAALEYLFCLAVQDLIQLSADADCPVELASATLVQGHSCYEINDVEKTWEEARKHCHDRNGRLATITDADLLDSLLGKVSQMRRLNNGVWLGLNDRSTEGVFLWDDYGDNHGV